MKRTVSIFLLILILLAAVAPSVSAAGRPDQLFGDAVSYTCVLDEATGKILVEGTVNHDVMIKYSGYKIRLYAVAPGEQVQDVVNDLQRDPIAETSMTIRFTFNIAVRTSLERYSKYAIIFCSESGAEYVAGTPMYPAVSSDFEYLRGDRSGYKGVLCESAALSADMGAGTVVVDVDMGKMLGENSDAILYPIKDTYIPFCKSYVEELDKKIITASVSGAKIYLRFLLGASDPRLCIAVSSDPDKRGFPNVYDEYTLDYLSSLSKFLMDRYSDGKGRIDGVIVGDRADDVESTNYIGQMTAEEYADAYVLYLTVIASAMRVADTTLDVVIPISDRDEYTSDKVSGTSATDFLNAVTAGLEYGTSGRFECSVILQSDTVPFGISNSNISCGVDTDASFGEGKIHADNVSYFIDHIRKLSRLYVSAPTNVIFMWEPSEELEGSALNASYAYIFYKLYGMQDISAFVVNAAGIDQLAQLSNVISYVDTQRGQDVTNPLLKYFGADTWDAVIGSAVNVKQMQSRLEVSAMANADSSNYRSSFVYYDFSDYNVFHNTFVGENGQSVYSTHDASGMRALQLRVDPLEVGHITECTYILDYDESLSLTPTISFTLGFDDGIENSSALYEVKLTLGKGNSRAVCKAIIASGDTQKIFFDISDYAEQNKVDYVKIGVRALTQSTNAATLRIYELRGYSNEYSDEELGELIEQQRAEQRNAESSGSGGVYQTVLTVVCIVFVLVVVAAGLYMAFRKEDNQRRSRSE